MKTLLVVESPNKAKKIRSFFPDFNIVATIGHFKELPKKEMGVSPPDHKPQWQVSSDKKKVVSQLLGAAKTADIIYVATDPDREGEAIAGHVVNLLGRTHQSKISRITYKEVTKTAIVKAIENKRPVDWYLVKAQEARRVLDRYIGYLVSPELSNKFRALGVHEFLSAGRVQSPAVRLVDERQNAINDFIPVSYFRVAAHMEKSDIPFTAYWNHPKNKNNDGLMIDENHAKSIQNRTVKLKVVQQESRNRNIPPQPPLTTSRYVQLMASALSMTTKKSMDVAQRLFESGLITYHRTDSAEMSEDFVRLVRAFAERNELTVPQAPRNFKPSDAAQAGHECLRVTDINLIDPRVVGLDDSELRAAYQLIWQVTLESQLADGINQITRVEFENGHGDTFETKASLVRMAGWRGVADSLLQRIPKDEATEEKVEKEEYCNQLPELKVGEVLVCGKVETQAKKTKPPALFTEKTLVAKLDELGIGRPSTYASIMERIVSMKYIDRMQKTLQLKPTLRGSAVTKSLLGNYSFFEYKYTAELEAAFDSIATGRVDYMNVVDSCYKTLAEEIRKYKNSESLPELKNLIGMLKSSEPNKRESSKTNKIETYNMVSGTRVKTKEASPGDKCTLCKNGLLAVKKIKNGKNTGRSFVGCSGFPTCRYFNWLQ